MYLGTERRDQDKKWMQGNNRTPKKAKEPGGTAGAPRSEDPVKTKAPSTGFPLSYEETQRLLKELQVLKEANAELEAFNATVSHDLCSPITAINGYCQVLTGICSDQLDDQAKEYLGSIYDATLNMKQLIASLLDFSRITQVALRREKIDLSKVAHEVFARLQLSEPERRVTFRIAPGITVDGDPALCRSVLDNIIGNAWKHSFGREKTLIEFGMTRLAGKPVCFVRDNGPGFDMASADRLFAPFQRIPGTAVEGHGIGLATADRIIRRHGGRIWAESTPNQGATFFFALK